MPSEASSKTNYPKIVHVFADLLDVGCLTLDWIRCIRYRSMDECILWSMVGVANGTKRSATNHIEKLLSGLSLSASDSPIFAHHKY